MSVTEPAPLHVPGHVKRVGILNRSESTKNKMLDNIDKILSAGGLNLDKEGAQNVVLGIKDEFEKNQTFDQIVVIESDKVENPGLGVFPSALAWSTVNVFAKQII